MVMRIDYPSIFDAYPLEGCRELEPFSADIGWTGCQPITGLTYSIEKDYTAN